MAKQILQCRRTPYHALIRHESDNKKILGIPWIIGPLSCLMIQPNYVDSEISAKNPYFCSKHSSVLWASMVQIWTRTDKPLLRKIHLKNKSWALSGVASGHTYSAFIKKMRLAWVQNGHKVTTTGCSKPFVSYDYDLRFCPSHPHFFIFRITFRSLQVLAEGL